MENNNLEKVRKQMRRGILEMCILSIISDGEIYPSDILGKLKKIGPEILVKEGTLYPLLTRLKNAGMLQYTWRESTQGPPRKYYSLTDEGTTFLEGLRSTWKELNTAVTKATKKTRTTTTKTTKKESE